MCIIDVMCTGAQAINETEDTVARSQVKGSRRKHFLTIRVEDYNRLDPEEWLNDSLVDLWMQW